MYIAPGLVYLHIPRTGGTFVSQVLDKHKLGSMRFSDDATGHEGAGSLPSKLLESHLVFATVRDPWSWYCSIDAHYRQGRRLDGFLHEIFTKSASFKDVIHTLTKPSDSSLARKSKGIRYPGARVPEDKFLARLEASGLGLWSWMILRTLCTDRVELVRGISQYLEQGDAPWSVDAVVDTAQIRDGLCEIIGAWRPELLPEMQGDIQGREAANKRAGHKGVQPNARPDPSYYDLEAQGWVNESDGWMIRRLGFDKPVGVRPPVQVLKR